MSAPQSLENSPYLFKTPPRSQVGRGISMTGKESSRKELIPKESFSEWYDNVLLEAKVADDRYPGKGFTVYTGWGFSVAKRIIGMLEEELENNGNEPMQFPVVIPEDSFQKEEDHIEGFSAEVFWITHAGANLL